MMSNFLFLTGSNRFPFRNSIFTLFIFAFFCAHLIASVVMSVAVTFAPFFANSIAIAPVPVPISSTVLFFTLQCSSMVFASSSVSSLGS